MSSIKDPALLAQIDQTLADASAALDDMVAGWPQIHTAHTDRIDTIGVAAGLMLPLFAKNEVAVMLMLAVERLSNAQVSER